VSLLYVSSYSSEVIPYSAEVIETKIEEKSAVQENDVPTQKSTTLFFVGDIMLGRDVENRMIENGSQYPFVHTEMLLKNPDLTIGNFEGIVPTLHKQTPSMGFQFSIRKEYLTTLRDVGFDVLSLANNHSGDYGREALLHTRNICRELLIVCAGSPNTLDEHSITTHIVNNEVITTLYLHSLWSAPSSASLDLLFAQIPKESTLLIAYIHWGDEYVLEHNTMQKKMAQSLIDRGVDVVIGHHPHVVQDVGLYKGRPIFYSLGNFIFDQYFSQHVQEGLGVQIDIEELYITYTLVPFTSKYSRNQPRPMEYDEAQILKERILEPLAQNAGIDTELGIIRIFR